MSGEWLDLTVRVLVTVWLIVISVWDRLQRRVPNALVLPAMFGALRPFSPLTPALDAIRAIVTESSGASVATLTLVGWLLVAFAASAVAITRRRTTTLAAVVAAS